MNSPNDVTFIIPVYNLEEYRIRNLKYILPYIIDTGCQVVVVEQSSEDTSNLSKILKEYPAVKHVFYITEEKRFHKTGLINYAVKNHVNTKYAWVNDADFYMKFKNVFNVLWTSRFIQPYDIGKKLNKYDSEALISGRQLNVDFTDASVKYISLYSALSFIFHVEEFLSINGMDESIYGWGYEDVEFSKRVKEKYYIQKMDFKGIHLWHPVKNELVFDKISRKDMAVITCHFNWCDYITPVRNLNRFLFQMESKNIPVYGVELSLSDKFVTSNLPNWKHITVNRENICFQKEACLNLIEKSVPPEYNKIAWIDYDMHFSNENWYEEASEKLETYKLLQLYSWLIETDRMGNVVSRKESTVYLGGPFPDGRWNGPPAGALAARREMWKHGGLYPYSFLGASDGIFINTVYDVPLPLKNEISSKKCQDWKSRIQKYISKNDISYVEGNLLHEWHGDKDGRNYFRRNYITEGIDYDSDIFINEQGLLEISKNKIDIVDNIIEYFKGRDEDGVGTNIISNSNFKKDMAVISCFFNWANFETPRRNLQRFKWQMDLKKIPFYGVELSLTENFVSENWKNWTKIKVSEKNVCFQKEACLNLIEKTVPDEYKKIAWIDPDIHFSNENWYADASIALDTHKVVQLFDRYITTDKSGNITLSLPSIVAAGGTRAKSHNETHAGQPGAAWAARRDLWLNGGLYPFSIIGGGDATFVYTIYEDENFSNIMHMSGIFDPEKFSPYLNWKKSITSYVRKEISFITGQIRHEWHGNTDDRKYGTRYDILNKINIKTDMRIGRNGLVEILVPSIYMDMLEYFKSRNEDGLINIK